MAKILLVDDDPILSSAVTEALSNQGYIVEYVTDGTEALDRLKYCHYDLAVLDWMLPGMSGVDVCLTFRKSGGHIPILMLTGKDAISEKEVAFEAGADEYLTKPFHVRELILRVRALLRRPPQIVSRVIEIDYLRIDVDERTVFRNGQAVELTSAEYALLELFMRHPGRLFNADELRERVFSTDSMAGDEAVRQRILRLRKKIDLEGRNSLIKTIKGVGYKLEGPIPS